MIRIFKITLLLIVTICLFVSPAMAKGKISTKVTVIHASTGTNQIDSGLSAIVAELKSVFKYTSYTLITSQNMNLDVKQQGQITLPEGRTLWITPMQMDNQRIPVQINILKNNQSIFQTQILLKNNSSVTIGGPQYKNGVLLFNISGVAR
ncbi:MAG: hypothetical protein ABIJ31_02065 [Pseudomonadota bacterium]